MFPFDTVVFFEDLNPWFDCAITLSSFQGDVEVRGPDRDDWVLGELRYHRLSDRQFVPPAQGGGLHLDMRNAATGRDGVRQMEDQVRLAIREKASAWMGKGKEVAFLQAAE